MSGPTVSENSNKNPAKMGGQTSTTVYLRMLILQSLQSYAQITSHCQKKSSPSSSTEQQKLSRYPSIWGAKHYRLFHSSYQVVLASTITYYRVLGRERECLSPAHLIKSANVSIDLPCSLQLTDYTCTCIFVMLRDRGPKGRLIHL